MIVLGLTLGACGEARKPGVASSTASRETTTSTQTSVAHMPAPGSDSDNDNDHNDDDYAWGQAASTSERLAVISLVRSYYAAAANDDGAKACTLLYSLLAEEIPETFGETPGPPALRGATCAVVMSKLFKQERHQLLTDQATLQVTAVRVKHLRGHALLYFARGPRDLFIHREHGTWKVDELLDSPLG
jgi:hypothetical protein